MKGEWVNCRKVLCIRLDNMGDVVMSGPAFRALKRSLACSITLLTSAAGAQMSKCMDEVDDAIVYEAPWVKNNYEDDAIAYMELIEELVARRFDAAVIFTVYSQSALPAAMLAMMAGIPLRLGYCRENPYGLLTDWVPDKEPYTLLRHQVERDLALVAHVGAVINDNRLHVDVPSSAMEAARMKLRLAGVTDDVPFLVLHPGVSEEKRRYPLLLWAKAGALLGQRTGYKIVITGSKNEIRLANRLGEAIGSDVVSLAGKLSVEEFVAVIDAAGAVITVNTATAHIAAACCTPVVVLYALTNPQHTPWRAIARVLPFTVPDSLRSKNEVVRYVSNLMPQAVGCPSAEDVANAVEEVLIDPHQMEEPMLLAPVANAAE
jgi:lipopolysaccharide heptosyltransferase II